MDQIEQKNIEFNAEGTLLRGWLFKPQAATGKLPCIVMSHGWGCIKELYLDLFAADFARAGFAVLVYDNRNFGESEGEIRQEIDPWQQVRDYRHAITFMQTQEYVDSEKIGIWGTSYSGGHVLVVAAFDKRVKCVVSQVPTISGYRTMLRRKAPGEWKKHHQELNQDRLNRFMGHEPKTMPIVSDPKQAATSSHAGEDAWNFFTGAHAPPEEAWRFKKWINFVTLRSVELYSEYEPGSYIERIAPIPLLMIVAENDTLAITDEALAAFNHARNIKDIIIIPGNHFAPYLEQRAFASQKALEWFKKYLHP